VVADLFAHELAGGQRLGVREREHHQVGLQGADEVDEVRRRHLGPEVVHLPAVGSQHDGRHRCRQRVLLVRRGPDDADPARSASRVDGQPSEEAFADGRGAVLLGHGQPPLLPGEAQLAQRRAEELLTEIERLDGALAEAVDELAGSELVTRDQEGVEALHLVRPAPHVRTRRRLRRRRSSALEPLELVVVDVVDRAPLHRRQRAVPHPAVGRLVVHAEAVGGRLQVHRQS
jgi:hypothetical protein